MAKSLPSHSKTTCFPGIYRDQQACETTQIYSDGSSLHLYLRGVHFSGRSPDELEPQAGTPESALQTFNLQQGDLWSFQLDMEIPIELDCANKIIPASLTLKFSLEGSDCQVIILLHHGDICVESSSGQGFVDDALWDIQKQLPATTTLCCCFTCRYGEYGFGMFGSMMCFRNCKTKYLAAQTKPDLHALYGHEDRQVQETWCCDEFCRRG